MSLRCSLQSLEQRRVVSGGSSDYAITKSSKIKTNESPSSSVQSLEQRRVLSGYVMTDSNIRTAVAAWLSDATAAESTYGHISTWDTSGVTDMSEERAATPDGANSVRLNDVVLQRGHRRVGHLRRHDMLDDVPRRLGLQPGHRRVGHLRRHRVMDIRARRRRTTN